MRLEDPETSKRLATKLLEVVVIAYQNGAKDARHGRDRTFSVCEGDAPDTGRPTWEVRDAEGNRYCGTNRGPFGLGRRHAERMMGMVEKTYPAGRAVVAKPDFQAGPRPRPRPR
jgi:hypothetical protein